MSALPTVLVTGAAAGIGATLYGATKADMPYLSQGLPPELSPQGVYVNTSPDLMDAEALADRARQALPGNTHQAHAATRYRQAA